MKIPLKVEQDWTFEILDADGSLVGKIITSNDAAEIVRRCNAHEALVKAVSTIVEECDHNPDWASYAIGQELYDQLKATLKLAGES